MCSYVYIYIYTYVCVCVCFCSTTASLVGSRFQQPTCHTHFLCPPPIRSPPAMFSQTFQLHQSPRIPTNRYADQPLRRPPAMQPTRYTPQPLRTPNAMQANCHASQPLCRTTVAPTSRYADQALRQPTAMQTSPLVVSLANVILWFTSVDLSIADEY